MTNIRTMRTPELNTDAFQQQLDRMLQEAGPDIRSRSEARLEDIEDRIKTLEDEGISTRAAIARTQAALAGLSKLLIQQEVNATDIEAERLALLASVNSLRESGIRVKMKKESTDADVE